jgi:hypothetical protein
MATILGLVAFEQLYRNVLFGLQIYLYIVAIHGGLLLRFKPQDGISYTYCHKICFDEIFFVLWGCREI